MRKAPGRRVRTHFHIVKTHTTRVWHRHKVWVGVTIAAICLLSVAVQVLYPQDRALPFASLGGRSVGYTTQDDLVLQAQDSFQRSQIVLRVADTVVSVPLARIGAEPDSDQLAQSLTHYPLWQRLIPFSLFAKWPYVNYQEIYYDKDVLGQFADEIAPQLSSDAASAQLAIATNGAITTSEQKAGFTVTPEMIREQLPQAAIQVTGATVIPIQATKLVPARSVQDIAPVRVQAEAALNRRIVLTVDGKAIATPDRATVASWLRIKQQLASPVALVVDEATLREYIEQINQQVKVEPGRTLINVQNGVERSRTPGAAGRSIDIPKLASTMSQVVMGQLPDGRVVVPMSDVAPIIEFSNGFTATREGLQAYVEHMGRTKNVRIKVEQLSGEQWTAEARATETTVSGSTYKLYVSLWLFDRMHKGEIGWNTPILDTNVAGCFERMTVASTNPCAEKFIAIFGGREALNDFVHSKGFSAGTIFSSDEAAQTTAADLNKFMRGLNDGTLIGGADRDRLLSSLSRHPYRYGIPTGSKGKVFDKVGFLWDYVNDTAIVQHPKGDYLVTIMTKGESYARIAEISREIERILYP